MVDALGPIAALADPDGGADLERRFGGLRRLHGHAGYERLRSLRLAVVGVGGVGSWAAEALARSGVASLTLIDLDQVAESNINRQVHALDTTVGQAKVLALQARIGHIHPGCAVLAVEEFVDEDNVATLLQSNALDGVLDCCDQVRAKAAVAAWGRAHGVPVVCVGAAGGKRHPHRLEVADLSDVSHDPLLASLRQRLRQRHEGARRGSMGLPCIFSREPVLAPQDATCGPDGQALSGDGSLNCAGYGSSVTVTATFGFVASAELINRLLNPRS